MTQYRGLSLQFTTSADKTWGVYFLTHKITLTKRGKYLPRFVSVNLSVLKFAPNEIVNIFKTFEVMDMGILWNEAHSNEDSNAVKIFFWFTCT